MAVLCRDEQRCCAILSKTGTCNSITVSSDLSFHRRLVNFKRNATHLHVSVRIGASLNQTFHNIQVTALARDEKWGTAVLQSQPEIVDRLRFTLAARFFYIVRELTMLQESTAAACSSRRFAMFM